MLEFEMKIYVQMFPRIMALHYIIVEFQLIIFISQ